MSRLPVALTLFRLMAGVAFLPLVLWHVPAWLLITLLVIGLLSDIADGIIARRLGVATLALRRLDTRGDIVFYGCATVAALSCALFPFARLWPWLYVYFVWSIHHTMNVEERIAPDFGDSLILMYTGLPVLLVYVVLDIVWGIQEFIHFFRYRDDRLGFSWGLAVLV